MVDRRFHSCRTCFVVLLILREICSQFLLFADEFCTVRLGLMLCVHWSCSRFGFCRRSALFLLIFLVISSVMKSVYDTSPDAIWALRPCGKPPPCSPALCARLTSLDLWTPNRFIYISPGWRLVPRRGCRAGRRVQLRRMTSSAAPVSVSVLSDSSSGNPGVSRNDVTAHTTQQSTDLDVTQSPTDLLSPVLSASLPTSPSQQLSTSTLSDYCVDFLFDGVLTQNLENTAISVSTFKPKRCKRFHFPVFLLANIRGGFASKLDEFQVLFNENNIDIAVLTETWLHSDITSDMLYIPGYTLFRLDRHDGRQGGGVAIYVKSTTDCFLLPDQSQHNFEVLWLVYRANYMPRELTHFLVGAIYHPPKANNYDLTDYLITTMDQVTRSHPNAGTVLLGDFNQLPDSLLKSYPLQQVVTSSTRGKSVLDKIFTSVSSWYQAPLILPAVSRSDHETILFQPAENPLRPSKSVTHTYRRITSHNRRALLFNDLQQHNWSHFFMVALWNRETIYIFMLWFVYGRPM